MRAFPPAKQTNKQKTCSDGASVSDTRARASRRHQANTRSFSHLPARASYIYSYTPSRGATTTYTERERRYFVQRTSEPPALSLSLGGVSFTTERPTAHACASLTDTLRPDARGSISFFRAACCVSSGIRCARRYTRTHNRQKEGKPPR